MQVLLEVDIVFLTPLKILYQLLFLCHDDFLPFVNILQFELNFRIFLLIFSQLPLKLKHSLSELLFFFALHFLCQILDLAAVHLDILLHSLILNSHGVDLRF